MGDNTNPLLSLLYHDHMETFHAEPGQCCPKSKYCSSTLHFWSIFPYSWICESYSAVI